MCRLGVAVTFSLLCAAFVLTGCGEDPHEKLVKQCKRIGLTKEPYLSACARGEEAFSAALNYLTNAEFNLALSELKKKQNLYFDKSVYRQANLKELIQKYGFSPFSSVNDDSRLKQAVGMNFKVSGQLSYYDHQDGEYRGPRTYDLLEFEGEGENTIEWEVLLDIESLNRYERLFINQFCDRPWILECEGTMYGRVGEIESERINYSFGPIGLILEHVEFESMRVPVPPWKMPNPEKSSE